MSNKDTSSPPLSSLEPGCISTINALTRMHPDLMETLSAFLHRIEDTHPHEIRFSIFQQGADITVHVIRVREQRGIAHQEHPILKVSATWYRRDTASFKIRLDDTAGFTKAIPRLYTEITQSIDLT